MRTRVRHLDSYFWQCDMKHILISFFFSLKKITSQTAVVFLSLSDLSDFFLFIVASALPISLSGVFPGEVFVYLRELFSPWLCSNLVNQFSCSIRNHLPDPLKWLNYYNKLQLKHQNNIKITQRKGLKGHKTLYRRLS